MLSEQLLKLCETLVGRKIATPILDFQSYILNVSDSHTIVYSLDDLINQYKPAGAPNDYVIIPRLLNINAGPQLATVSYIYQLAPPFDNHLAFTEYANSSDVSATLLVEPHLKITVTATARDDITSSQVNHKFIGYLVPRPLVQMFLNTADEATNRMIDVLMGIGPKPVDSAGQPIPMRPVPGSSARQRYFGN